MESFISALLAFCSETEASTELHDVHVEVLNMLITLLSTQVALPFVMQPPANPARPEPHPDAYLYHAMAIGETRVGIEAAGARSSTAGSGTSAGDGGGAAVARRNTVACRLVTALLRNFTARLAAPPAVATLQTNASRRAKELAPKRECRGMFGRCRSCVCLASRRG